MGKKGFHFNQSLCSGCHSCMMVCKENHHLPEGAFFRRVSSFVSENGSKPGVFHLSLACNHCMDPACVANCPVGPCTLTKRMEPCSMMTARASAASPA